MNKLPEFIGKIERQKVAALRSCLSAISGEVAALVPIATSTLINSQYAEVSMRGTALVGRIGFTAEYALAVHEAAGKWVGLNKPRPKRNGRDAGFYWGPNDGQPGFLTEAAERAAPAIHKAMLAALRPQGPKG
ncbi:hypothetical protein [Aquabacterium sp. OR-4]|uniref:hypothetical protein n=1 Tax=Aquabacterium sp. OR-4 TaxID=2978127 RepID=UPI0021B1F62B|nr:hypothetical protein [Aquabacterium sp. OR-4]MDT7836632.1 hypothetical protein [Aquabacterium sp. OR-4]